MATKRFERQEQADDIQNPRPMKPAVVAGKGKSDTRMLRRIGKEDYFKVAHIFNELEKQIVIGSVIEGNTCGDIYVNNLENPTFAVLWDKMDAILVEGTLSEDYLKSFAHLITRTFVPDAKSRSVPVLNIYYPNETWRDIIKDQIKDLSPTRKIKFYYEFDKLGRAWGSIIPRNYTLKWIDLNFLEQKDIENLEQVIGWIKSFWPSTNSFLNKGIGYCLVQDKIIISWCLSVFVSTQKYELGLETIKDYRGKGYAKVVSSACIKYCMENDFTPIWNCDAENEASIHVAEAIGFMKKSEYNVWHLNLSETP